MPDPLAEAIIRLGFSLVLSGKASGGCPPLRLAKARLPQAGEQMRKELALICCALFYPFPYCLAPVRPA